MTFIELIECNFYAQYWNRFGFLRGNDVFFGKKRRWRAFTSIVFMSFFNIIYALYQLKQYHLIIYLKINENTCKIWRL